MWVPLDESICGGLPASGGGFCVPDGRRSEHNSIHVNNTKLSITVSNVYTQFHWRKLKYKCYGVLSRPYISTTARRSALQVSKSQYSIIYRNHIQPGSLFCFSSFFFAEHDLPLGSWRHWKLNFNYTKLKTSVSVRKVWTLPVYANAPRSRSGHVYQARENKCRLFRLPK